MFINGYKIVYCPEHHSCIGNSGCVYEHILLAEKKLGRELKPEEVVHHADMNRSNNSLDNLWIFATKAEHTSFHQTGKYYQDSEGIYHSELYSDCICPKCGGSKTRGSSCCLLCRRASEQALKLSVSRDTLKGLIRTQSFEEIGRKFEVTGNAIKKWCDYYKLSRKKSLINKISDKDWENI